MNRILNIALLSGLIGTLIVSGCNRHRTAEGAAIGAGVGGVIGAITGHQIGNAAVGAIIGAAVGGTAGAAIGNYMDRQAADMKKDLKNAKVERVGEGIRITYDNGILFDTDSSDLKVNAKNNVDTLAQILQKYPNTNVLVAGYTDSTGSAQYNFDLSKRRAESVKRELESQGVKGDRLTDEGFGKDQPVADNSTVEGRAKNRRVELAIFADEKLKQEAREGKLD